MAEFKPLVALKKFLSTEDRPVTNEEFTQFWASCSDADKADFRAYAEEYLRD